MFLVHTRFWVWTTIALLAACGAVFAAVAVWHKQGKTNQSDTLGYFGAMLAGLGGFAGLITFFVWLGDRIF